MTDRMFSHPSFGKEVRVEIHGREVHLVFVGNTAEYADELADDLLAQLKSGAINLTLMGKPTSITEE